MPKSSNPSLNTEYEHSGKRLKGLNLAELGTLLRMRMDAVCNKAEIGNAPSMGEVCACVEALNAIDVCDRHYNDTAVEFVGFQKFELLLEEAAKASQ